MMAGALANKSLIVLDRDGVINRDSSEFVKSAEEWIPLEGSIEAIASLSKAGFAVAVASNQSGLARGLFDLAALVAMHTKMQDLVAAAGGHVDHIVYCPHGPDDSCDCRKPKAGLLLQIAAHFDTTLTGTPVIGDSLRDLQAAASVGARPILVRTGNGARTEEGLPSDLSTTEVYDDLGAAVLALLER